LRFILNSFSQAIVLADVRCGFRGSHLVAGISRA
jgi:hypothetical protein